MTLVLFSCSNVEYKEVNISSTLRAWLIGILEENDA